MGIGRTLAAGVVEAGRTSRAGVRPGRRGPLGTRRGGLAAGRADP